MNSVGMITVDTKQYSVGRKYIGQNYNIKLLIRIYTYTLTQNLLKCTR